MTQKIVFNTFRTRAACLTFYTKPTFPEGACDYLIYGEEICPTTGRTHWQSYAEFDNAVTMSTIKKRFKDKTIHIEARRGSQLEAITYCKKDGKYTEVGKAKSQGQRTDLEIIAKDLVEGNKTIEDVMVENPLLYCKYRNGLKDLGGLGAKRKASTFRKIYTEVLFGDAGTGKTRKAVEENPDHYILDTDGDGKLWFDGYNGESTLILDDFYGGIKYSYLLRLLDGYKCRLDVKGSFTYAQWTKIIITSNKDPREWYHYGLTGALDRRITKITRM